MVDWNNNYIALLKEGDKRKILDFSLNHNILNFDKFDYPYLFKTLTGFEEKNRNGFVDNFIGTMYMEGNGCVKNEDKAIEYFESANKKGFSQGYVNIGSIYLKRKDYEKAYNYLCKAATDNNPFAYNNLAVMYQDGYFVTKDNAKSLECIKKSCEAGFFLNYALYAKRCYNEMLYEETFKYFQLAEKHGINDAIVGLAMCYFNGVGTEKNPQKAVHYLNLINNKTENDYFHIGLCYVELDDVDNSIEAFKKAGEPGKEKIKLIEEIVKENEEEQFFNLQKLADEGNSDAQYELGKLLYEKYKNIDEAKKYLLMSKNAIAPFIYGKICYDEQDFQTAFYYFEKASDRGFSDANLVIGCMYEKGVGCEVDPIKALESWKKSRRNKMSISISKYRCFVSSGKTSSN